MVHDSLNSLGNRPKKSLGQNFLVDGNIIQKIVDALDLDSYDTVFEIGSGRGALTNVLMQQAENIIALEKDRELAYALKAQWPGIGVILGDGLAFGWESLEKVSSLKIVGNLPYNVASPLMWEIFSRVRTFEKCCFMVQKEVALRICAKPGSKVYGGLSVWLQTFAIPNILFHVSPSCFYPAPRVESSVVAFVPRPLGNVDKAQLARTIHLLFQKRRKQLGTILKPFWNNRIATWLEVSGLDRRVRPENLTPGQFGELSSVFMK